MSSVLEATLDELAARGYAAFRIEEVAARAGVSRTTVYRRWPTKAALVEEALVATKVEEAGPTSGHVRTDLLALFRQRLAHKGTSQARCIARALLVEATDPEVGAMVQRMRTLRNAPFRAAIEGGIERGELPKDTDPHLVLEPLFAAMYTRVLLHHGAFDEGHLERLLDLILAGAKAGAAGKRKPRRPAAKALPH